MIITGNVVEVGHLEEEYGEIGVVLTQDNGEFLTIKGLSEEQVTKIAQKLYSNISVTISLE